MTDEICFPSGNCLPIVDGPDGEDQEYWDPNNSDNPLLDTSTETLRETQLAANFKAKEFARSGGKTFSKCRIDPELVDLAQTVRSTVNKPVVVNSGYRSWDYNLNTIYGGDRDKATLSEHCSGRGVDIKVEGMTPVELGAVVLEQGDCDTRIGVGSPSNGTFHFDIKPRQAWPDHDGMWSYPSGEKPNGWNDLQSLRSERDKELGC